MSLLLGTIKNKLGFLRQFKDMSLAELDFQRDVDYMLDDSDELDGDDDSYPTNPTSSKKRPRGGDDLPNLRVSFKKERMEVEEIPDPPSASTSRSIPEFDPQPELVCMPPPKTSGRFGRKHMKKPLADYASSTDADSESEERSSDSGQVPENADLSVEVTVEDVLTELESVYVEQRSVVVTREGFISTPLHALKVLCAKFNDDIRVENTNFEKPDLPKALQRVELFVGPLRGVGEAFHKRMAAQMAALDVLLKVQTLGSGSHIPPYAIFPGWRIRPRVFQDLVRICVKNGLRLPRYITKSNIDDPEKPVTLVECRLGKELIAIGESDLAYVARKLAAYNAIDYITGEKYPLEYVALGSATTSYEELVELNAQPVINEFRKSWLLEEPTNGITDEARGVDISELEALQKQTYQEELKAIKEKKVNFSVTIANEPGRESSSPREVRKR